MYPYNFKKKQTIQTNAPGIVSNRTFIAHITIPAVSAIAATTDGVLAAAADNGVEQRIINGINNPIVPRNITATAGGVATDIKAIQVTIEGTNYADEVISEILPSFTVDTAGTVVGSKAFKTVTSVTIPAHDGTGATTSIGFGDVLGIPYKLKRNTVQAAFLNNAKEGTDPLVTVDSNNIESNTVELINKLNGTQVDLYVMV